MTYSVLPERKVSVFTLNVPKHVDVWRPLVCTCRHSGHSPKRFVMSVAVIRAGNMEPLPVQKN